MFRLLALAASLTLCASTDVITALTVKNNPKMGKEMLVSDAESRDDSKALRGHERLEASTYLQFATCFSTTEYPLNYFEAYVIGSCIKDDNTANYFKYTESANTFITPYPEIEALRTTYTNSVCSTGASVPSNERYSTGCSTGALADEVYEAWAYSNSIPSFTNTALVK